MIINISSLHFDADQKLLDYIEQKLAKMEKYFDRIQDAKVVMRLENNGQVKDKVVELNFLVPGRVIFTKAENKTFEKAFDIALSNAKRQIKRYKERLQAKH